MSTTHIFLWASPRNISTALMYAFAQRKDTLVVDEPLYAFYLANSDAAAYHPGAEEILATMEQDGEKAIQTLLQNQEKPVAFYKGMTHHLLHLNRGFLSKVKNVILTREPKAQLASFSKVIQSPTMDDVGYAQQAELLNHLIDIGNTPIVIDSARLLKDPENCLIKLCKVLEIPFDKGMLSWQAGPRSEDGCWAPYWYKSVHTSTGFAPYREKEVDLPKHLTDLYLESKKHYNKLIQYAL